MTAAYQGSAPVAARPQARSFWSPPQQTSEAALITHRFGQLYAVLGEAVQHILRPVGHVLIKIDKLGTRSLDRTARFPPNGVFVAIKLSPKQYRHRLAMLAERKLMPAGFGHHAHIVASKVLR